MPLTDAKIRNTKPGTKPIKLTDVGGLYLLIKPTGKKLWRYRYRYRIEGRESTYAIGTYPDTGLAKARSERDAARKLAFRRVRSIPAYAGEANQATDLTPVEEVDPRVRGGGLSNAGRDMVRRGRSPRTRGRRVTALHQLAAQGSIPAYAGEAFRPVVRLTWKEVDPRVRGGGISSP